VNNLDYLKILGYIIYAIGIVGGVEGVVKKSVSISLVAIGVFIIGSILLGMEKPTK
jgi:hypothetical protein